jgi:YggT family protein
MSTCKTWKFNQAKYLKRLDFLRYSVFINGLWKQRNYGIKVTKMFILANFFDAIAGVLGWALDIYMWIVIAGAVLSWVSPDPYNPIVRFINNATEPVFYQIRKRLPVNLGGLDISPIIVILAIYFLQRFVVSSLHGLARTIA